MSNKWLTPDSAPTDKVCRRLFIPNDRDWIAIVSGCLSSLIYAYNFEQYGTATPAETAAVFESMFDEYSSNGKCHMIGEMFLWSSKSTAPPGYGVVDVGDVLRCNGDEATKTLYPELNALIGGDYGAAASGKFKLPNTQSRMIKDREQSGSDQVGNTGGAATHTLTSGEMPAHTHSEITATPSVGAAITGVPVPSAIPGVGITGSSGGGGAHNNMPPYIVMRWYIQAR